VCDAAEKGSERKVVSWRAISGFGIGVGVGVGVGVGIGVVDLSKEVWWPLSGEIAGL